MDCIIYKITCPNGKMYIGQTTQEFGKRMNQHKNEANHPDRGGCRALYNAIRKYGWDNFVKEIIHECSVEELDSLEQYYIENFNTMVPNGYNLLSGGNKNKKASDETREKIRQAIIHRRQNPETKSWPKYLNLSKGRPAIRRHPNCRYKLFNDKNKTFKENVDDALFYLEALNNGDNEIIEKGIKPVGLQLWKDGYVVEYKNSEGKRCSKKFGKQNIPLEIRYQQATEFLKLINE